MLEIKDLTVAAGDKVILKDMSLSIERGETVILFGPNGSGKSTLLKAVMGLGDYRVVSGDILFKGRRLNDLPIEQRVKTGLGIMFQHPPSIRGVTLRQLARFLSPDEARVDELAERLSLQNHLDRDINMNFSGGEAKRAELFQLLLQNPDFILLDEPESGVDIENISLMGGVLNDFLKQEGKSAFIITHTGYIMDYVDTKRGCVMLNGTFWCMSDPREIFRDIREEGYEKCVTCDDRKGFE